MTSPATQPARDLSGKKLGRYEMLAQLASGGMATVYVARAQGVAGFERLVAIKVLHPHLAHDDEFISMFLDEARLAARIRHPNVVPTLDISDSQGDGYFLVMEYIEGDHLGALLREAARGSARLPVPVTLRIVVDALEGLSAAHSLKDGSGKALGIVHRDISPHNILLGTDGIARITDFGVAKAEVRLSSTRDGQFKGKLAYMAPEQASNGTADQRSDLFSMAIVLWESLTGRRLFRADNNGELLNRLLNAPIPSPSEYVPELTALDPVLAKALSRDSSQRYQTAAEFVEAIEGAAAAVGGLAAPRVVSKSVREWLGTKIDNEATRIHTAIDSLGRSEVSSSGDIPRPEGSAFTPVTKTGPVPGMTPSAVRPIKPEDATIGATPKTVGPVEEPARDRRGLYIGAALLLIVVVLAIGGLAMFGGGTPPPSSVVTVAPSTVVAIAPPASVAAPPSVVAPPTSVAVLAPPPPTEVAPPPPTTATESGGGSHGRRPHRPRPATSDDDDDLLANPYRH